MTAITRRTLTLAAIAAVAVTSTLPATAQDALPPAEQLIDRHVEAVGGRAAVLGHSSSRVTGTFSMPAAGIEGTILMMAASPNLSVSRVEIAGLGIIRSGFDGEFGWSIDPNIGPRLVEGLELAASTEGGSQLAAVRDASLFDIRETIEKTEVNGQECYKVRLVWKSGRETFDCYSVETGLMVASMALQESPMGEIETTTLLEEYREMGGVLSATRIRQQMLGQEQIMTLDTIEYDVVEPEAFEAPEAIKTLIQRRREG